MATILAIVQEAAALLRQPNPTSLVGNTYAAERLWLAEAHSAVREVSGEYNWPQLHVLHQITLTASASYALPGDFNGFISDTEWNQTSHWPLRGAITPAEWNARNYGVVSQLSRQRFRIKGYGDNQFVVTPTPSGSELGQIVSFEYLSSTCILPKRWTTSTVFAANAYCSYNGNIYKTTAGGTTGATPPTHTAGSVSDGGVTWAYQSDTYDTFLADTDSPILDSDIIKNEIRWRWLRDNGQEFEAMKAEAMAATRGYFGDFVGAGPLSMAPRPSMHFINGMNIRDTNWGS